MDSVAVRSVKQLPNAEKRSLESLVGSPLEDSQQVFILAFTPSSTPSDQARKDATAGLTQTWEKVQQHMETHGISDEEFDAAADEAVEKVRRHD